MNRKDFLSISAKAAAFFGISTATAASGASLEKAQLDHLLKNDQRALGNMLGFKADPISRVRIGLIGLGNRGQTHCEVLKWMVENGMAEITALGDKVAAKVDDSWAIVSKFQKNKPPFYSGSEEAWRKMIEQPDIDLIIVSTPWEHHAIMCEAAMLGGKHVACEVPIACTLEDCWRLIEVAEKQKKHCIMLENCCFNDEELWILNMIQEGVFGELTHAEGAYLHDLRGLLLDKKYYEDQWRIKHHIDKDENLYTTHGLGPISFYFNIGRGDTFSHLVSMSSLQQNLSKAAQSSGQNFPKFRQGDMNTTLIRTVKGKTIMLQHDVHTGRPYSRINTILGTGAVHQGYPSRLYIEPHELKSWGHEWLDQEDYDRYWKQYMPPVWTKLGEQIKDNAFAHGGMDFVMLYRLIRCLNLGESLDISLYDGVMWSAITPLSGVSVSNNSSSVLVPDFTGGTWQQQRKPEVLRTLGI